MQTTDWKFDFSKLPHWENRDLLPYIYDDFIEIPQRDALCCLYSIAEVSMCNYQGFFAILKNKKNPELFLNIAEYPFCDNISVSPKGNFIFLQPSLYNKKKNIVQRPILIIDIEKSVFSYIPTDNINPCYKVTELKENIFKIDADAYQSQTDKRLHALSRKKICVNRLKWYRFTELVSLPGRI